MPEIVILGAGVMGAAMSLPATHQPKPVTLVGTPLDADIIDSVSKSSLHPRLGIKLPACVTAMPWTALGGVMGAAPQLLILGVSSMGVSWAIDQIAASMTTPVPILMITKGLSHRDGSIEILPTLVEREIERRTGIQVPVMAVGGPCIAGELAALRDTSVIIAGTDLEKAKQALSLLEAPFYHARLTDDLKGVEVCAAFKNFYAIAVGASNGMLEVQGKASNGALMHNLAASVFNQALAEMTILVKSLGGQPQTVQGLAGTGDLYVTCLAGRNGRMGRLLGLGLSYSRAKSEHMLEDTVEGANLALDLGAVLEEMMARGELPSDGMPLTKAIVAAICRDEPLRLPFEKFHR